MRPGSALTKLRIVRFLVGPPAAGGIRTIPATISAASICWASRYGLVRADGFPTPMPRGRAEGMKLRSISRRNSLRASPTRSIPAISSACRLGRGVGGNAADHRTRRIAAAGAGAVVDVTGIPEEMTMDCCESRTSPVATRRCCCSVARRRPPGPTCRNSARRGRARSAADRRDPAGALDGLATVAPTGDPIMPACHVRSR